MLPTKQQKKYTLSILAGLVVNILLNWILIITNGAYGAAFSTTISQFVVVLVQMYYVRDEIDIKKAIYSGKKYLIASVVMLITCFIVGIIVKTALISVAFKMIIGMIVYLLMLIILGEKYVYEVRDIILRKLKRK